MRERIDSFNRSLTGMDTHKPVAEMSDQELVREWECLECDVTDTERTRELAAEMDRRQIVF